MKLIYLAHPFGGKKENVEKAEKIITDLIHRLPEQQKGRRGNASADARIAQIIICERSGVDLKMQTSREKAPRYDGCDGYDPEHGWCHNRDC